MECAGIIFLWIKSLKSCSPNSLTAGILSKGATRRSSLEHPLAAVVEFAAPLGTPSEKPLSPWGPRGGSHPCDIQSTGCAVSPVGDRTTGDRRRFLGERFRWMLHSHSS